MSIQILCIKQITNENLLYCIGNFTQYAMVTTWKRNLKTRGDMYVYIQLIHFAVQKKLTQHCKATIPQQKFKKKLSKKGMSILMHKGKKKQKTNIKTSP